MFSKIFKKSVLPDNDVSVTQPIVPVGPTWESRLQAALGNDTELLALAIDAQLIDHKLSAVQALSGEEGLRTAEREFRKHDRRVHGLAKQRYETLVRQRETRANAAILIQASASMINASMIPANRLVELNRAWALLDPAHIEEEQKSKFSQLQEDLAETMRKSGEHKRAVSRWSSEAKQILVELNSACAGIAVAGAMPQELSTQLAAIGEKARTILASMPPATSPLLPEESALADLGTAIQSALQDLILMESKLAILGELHACQTAMQNADETTNPPPTALMAAASERWQGLPPLANTGINNAFNTRFDEYLHFQDDARKKLRKQNSLIAKEKNQAELKTRIQIAMAVADAAEAALAAGHLAEAGKQLATLQTASDKGETDAALQVRIGTLQVEFSRLKGWQHWGGGRVRDDLVVEAETLAASTVAEEGSRPVKLPLKQLEKNIEQLRARWKELDRLGGATSKTLWQRFDGALKTAYLPVAAHLAQLNEARHENLAARKALLAVLDALDIAADHQSIPDWKKIGHALAHFQTEWRKLGPLEHTVPHKSQATLLEHMKASIERLEMPLKEAQASAQTEREQLILRTKALANEAQSREAMMKLRELQSQWQSHAKAQPLPRKIENQLWAEFKAASDTLMSQREAAFSARDAEFKASQTVREALIVQLDALHQDTPQADIKRILASVDTEWRKAGEPPRNQAAKLEAGYQAARKQAQEHLAGSARRIWQLTCDALRTKLALCEELESAASGADIQTRWESLADLPPRWEQALQERFQAGGKGTNRVEPFDRLLLQLESLLEIPTPEAFMQDRRALKLQVMKNAMEGRKSEISAPSDIEKVLAVALSYKNLDPTQKNRLASIVAAISQSEFWAK